MKVLFSRSILYIIFAVLASVWIACRDASATSRIYQPLNRFIAVSDVIAVVETEVVKPRERHVLSENSEYTYTTEVVVKQVLKGDVSGTLRVFMGRCGMMCYFSRGLA